MSSTVLTKTKVKKASKTKTKQPVSEIDPEPAPSSKGHKHKLAKPEEYVQKTKSKPVKGEGTKPDARPLLTTAQRARHNTVPSTRKHDNAATRLARKPRGPWKAPSPSPPPDVELSHSEEDEPEAPQEEEPEEGAGSADENVHLYGFSTDEDSSDDDPDVDEGGDVDVGSLPTVARDDATVKRKLEKAKRKPASEVGVIYLGRVPHGFFEDQLRAYFSQFGEISRLRLSRNKRTGRSKHYGFIEFASAPVAQIVAETMDNYLLMGHILTCKVIPKEKVHPELWVGANRRWRVVPTYRLAQAQHNKPRTEMQQHAAEKRLLSRQKARKRKLAELGIVYKFDKVEYKKPKSTS